PTPLSVVHASWGWAPSAQRNAELALSTQRPSASFEQAGAGAPARSATRSWRSAPNAAHRPFEASGAGAPRTAQRGLGTPHAPTPLSVVRASWGWGPSAPAQREVGGGAPAGIHFRRGGGLLQTQRHPASSTQ